MILELVQASLSSAMSVRVRLFSSLPAARWRMSHRLRMKTSSRSRFLCMNFLSVSSLCDHICICTQSFCTSVHLCYGVGYLLLLLWCLCVYRVYGVYVSMLSQSMCRLHKRHSGSSFCNPDMNILVFTVGPRTSFTGPRPWCNTDNVIWLSL